MAIKERFANSSRFNPNEYLYRGPSLDATFWTELGPNDKSGQFKNQGFKMPKINLRKDWPDVLNQEHGVKAQIRYDPKISGILLEITPQMIEAERLSMNKHIVRSLEDPVPIPPPETITAEQALSAIKIRLMARYLFRHGIFARGDEPSPKLTDFEQRVLQWRPGYGFLWDYTSNSGIFFPEPPKDYSAFRYEVVQEFLFHIPPEKADTLAVGYYSGVVLSLAQEPNSNRAIWGFRRDLATDWPEAFPTLFVDKMNSLIFGLAKIIDKNADPLYDA